MACNKDEAIKAKAMAERKMQEKDFVGAKKMIIKMLQATKEVDDISKMLTICDVHCAAGAKINGEIDWYGILQVPVTADDTLIRRQFRKLVLLLHPDKNKFGGAEAAFKLVGEANMMLTDHSKRSVYDVKRKIFRSAVARPSYQQSRRCAPARPSATPVNLYDMHQQRQQQASNSTGPQTTFWTICPSCGTGYQYYLSVLNKALCCQNCFKPFTAHDLREQAVPSGSNEQIARQWKNAGAPPNLPVSQTDVAGQKAWNSATHGVHVNINSGHADANTKKGIDGNTGGLKGKMESSQATINPSVASSSAGLKRDRRAVVESSEEEIGEHGPAANNARPGQQTHQSSRQKNEAKSNEVSDDDDIEADGNTSLKRLRKSGMFQCDHSNKTTKLNEDIAGHNGPINGVNYCINTEDKKKGGENTFNITEQMKRETMQVGENSDVKGKVFDSVSSNAPDPNCDDASDNYRFIFENPGFFNFDELRDVGWFRANQIWSVYDDQGCMRRLYARITKLNVRNKSAAAECFFRTELCLEGLIDEIRQDIDDGPMAINAGRHPILETLHTDFVPNNIFLSEASNMILVMGPNMSGKSTYLQQICLIVNLAQIGCYVPAQFASLRVVDRIFTRIGNGDNVENNSSTFMTEMKETAFIMQNVSSKSLIVVDELGRATSSSDGLAVAWSCCEHLLSVKAYTVFATHMEGLSELATMYPNVKILHFEVDLRNDRLDFKFRLKDGVRRVPHYGLLLARVSGLPASVIDTATSITSRITEQEMTKMDANCEEFGSLRTVYQVAQRLVCLKYSNQGDDYIREALRNLKESYAAGWLT